MFHFLKKKKEEREKNRLTSMQLCAVDFITKQRYFPESNRLAVVPTYSIMIATINGQKSIVCIHAVMYPQNMNVFDREQCMKDVKKSAFAFDLNYYDIYFWGIGLMQKNVPEEEMGIFEIGKTYSVVLGELVLLQKCAAERYGYSEMDPVKMSEVADEYYFMQHLFAQYGTIVGYDRMGSWQASGDKPIDKWRIQVECGNSVHMIRDIYLDPYAYSPTDPNKQIIAPEGFSFKPLSGNNK